MCSCAHQTSLSLFQQRTSGALVVAGLAVTVVGMVWLSRVDSGSNYWIAVALPMVLLGAGHGFGFAPLTAAGISDVHISDAGACPD